MDLTEWWCSIRLGQRIEALGIQKKVGVFGWFPWEVRIGPRLVKGDHWKGGKEVTGSRTEAIAQSLVCSKPKQIVLDPLNALKTRHSSVPLSSGCSYHEMGSRNRRIPRSSWAGWPGMRPNLKRGTR